LNAQPHPDDLPEQRGPVFHFTMTPELREVFKHMEAYAAHALSSRDVADELGMDRVTAAAQLVTLTRLRFVGTVQGNKCLLYRWREDDD
jgi:hypothetical protein